MERLQLQSGLADGGASGLEERGRQLQRAGACARACLLLSLCVPPDCKRTTVQAVLETGEPFCGCFYTLPQYHAALDVRQGAVIFHRRALCSDRPLLVRSSASLSFGERCAWDLESILLCLLRPPLLPTRSSDADVGVHANSGIWRSSSSSHRIALVRVCMCFEFAPLRKAIGRATSTSASSAQTRPLVLPAGPHHLRPPIGLCYCSPSSTDFLSHTGRTASSGVGGGGNLQVAEQQSNVTSVGGIAATSTSAPCG